ncbi:hypothetical protein FE414_07235 [Leuconostoc carnosum]|uniref:bifunctional DNA primase/polymerase n=1 Tax=Leuconostoc carnosum TaxID=1252 RepID=UPI00123938FA|nr:bifunctional DNA primase/polymerase [Leuconostoc carnosum]KAA8369822.1 hypothetical protein FE414_07235 [Leuconostoc carnosum]
MATKSEALKWLANGHDITPIQVNFDNNGHASKKPFLSYATDKVDKLWVLSNWKRTYAIGLVLSGEDYTVFDFDSMDVLEAFKKEHPVIMSGVHEKSVTGRGIHVYFQNNEGLTQIIGIIHGLDIKASKNNYVVVDPETDLDEVKELPEELWTFYQKNKSNGYKAPLSNDLKDYTIHELDMIVDGFGAEGTRNANMSLLVWTLFTLGFSKRQVSVVVELANERSGLTDSEIEKTITTSWRKWTNGS